MTHSPGSDRLAFTSAGCQSLFANKSFLPLWKNLASSYLFLLFQPLNWWFCKIQKFCYALIASLPFFPQILHDFIAWETNAGNKDLLGYLQITIPCPFTYCKLSHHFTCHTSESQSKFMVLRQGDLCFQTVHLKKPLWADMFCEKRTVHVWKGELRWSQPCKLFPLDFMSAFLLAMLLFSSSYFLYSFYFCFLVHEIITFLWGLRASIFIFLFWCAEKRT